MLIDEAIVQLTSGHGGAGAATFHREKHVPRGGPNGADGGRGGDIVLVADQGKRTLIDFHLRQAFEAAHGHDAVGNKSGKHAEPIEIKVPVGTIVYDDETGSRIADLITHGMRLIVCKGGRGGHGNLHYTSSVRQAPRIAEKGAPGQSLRARLELNLLADIALVGLPNAGKSTLISRISAAKPRIADYPFTTIEPNLGVVRSDDTSFVVADMPGLIEGAHEGKGLGHRFLKHVERTKALVHVVEVLPLDESDPLENYRLVEKELKAYSEEMWARPRIIALNKIDVLPQGALAGIASQFKGEGHQVFPISGVSGEGIELLVREMAKLLQSQEEKPQIPVYTPTLTAAKSDDSWEARRTDNGFVVTGKRVERIVAMTPMENEEAVQYLHSRLERMGVLSRLRDLGADEGDTVRIGEMEFSYSEN